MEERDKVQVEAKSLLKERNSENNNEWGTKSLLKERKFPIKDRKKTEETSRKVFGPDNI